MSPQQQPDIDDDQIDIRELIRVLWHKKWLILAVTFAFASAAAIAALVVPKSYKAVVVLSAVSNVGSNQLGSVSSLVSQLGGVASLAGLSVGGDTKKSESIAVLQSEAITEKYISENNLLPVLFERQWDKNAGKWKPMSAKRMPTLWKANDYFKKRVRSVVNETKTGLVTLTITWKDAQTAAKWANDLVALTNDYLRGKAIDETDRDISFLNEEALKTNVVEAKAAIYKILESEISKGMIARGSKEYAFKILDPAFAPDRPASPEPVLWISAATFAGLLLSSAVVFLLSRPRTSASS
jgi:uncharacterized protein involved in exopolysaccharide biosynthesis